MTKQLAKVCSDKGTFTVVYDEATERYIVYNKRYGADGNVHKTMVHKCADYGSALQTITYQVG